MCCFAAARNGSNVVLDSMAKRKQWEQQFDKKYIKPTFNQKVISFTWHCLAPFT